MTYTGRMIPAKRKVAIPHAVACLLPFLFACQKTPIETAAAITTLKMKAPGLMFPSAASTVYVVTAARNSSIESAETV